MSAPPKKRGVEKGKEIIKNKDSGSSDESSDEEKCEDFAGQEIQVEFEGRMPIDADFHGIKQLLNQLFLKAHVNLSELTDLIIGQNYIGSVVKQSDDGQEDSDDEEMDTNDVFGITTVINITDKQSLECIQQLRGLLREMCEEHATDDVRTIIRSLLQDDTRPVGMLINERFINIPAQIAVPLLENLQKELQKARDKKMPFELTHFVMICKLHKVNTTATPNKIRGNKKHSTQPEIIWSNPEEEIIDQMAECKFEFSVKSESDSGISGQWMEDDEEMTPYRRVLIIRSEQLGTIIDRIKTFLQSTTNAPQ